MSVFIRFLPFGDNLFVAVDSYVLGPLDVFTLIKRIIITLVSVASIFLFLSLSRLLSTARSAFDPFSSSPPASSPDIGSLLCCIVPLLLFVVLLWLNVFRAYKQHGSFNLALRQQDNYAPSDHSFNADDILMFFKSVLPLVVFSVRNVLEKNGLEVQTLNEFAAHLNNVNSVVNISTGGGFLSIIGSAIGAGNRT